jgi:deoxycytidine triphosphate deaminase
MILGHSELRKLVKSQKLVTGLSKRERENPEGCVFDLRLDKLFKLKGEAFLGIKEREAPNVEEVASYNPKKKTKHTIKQGEYYLTKTIEKVNLPEDIAALFKPRTTLFRSGLILRTGFGNPGYKGPLFFGLYNAGGVPATIEMGARYVASYFVKVKGKPVHKYRGQWQGGRVTTKGREKQI